MGAEIVVCCAVSTVRFGRREVRIDHGRQDIGGRKKRKKVSNIFGSLKTLLTFAPRRNGTKKNSLVKLTRKVKSSDNTDWIYPDGKRFARGSDKFGKR